MSVLHDYECAKHGVFECTHPICPHLGCDSSKVKMVFLKAPGIKSAKTKQFDKGIRRAADQMNLPNFRSAQHEGDSSYGGHSAGKMLWGNEAAAMFGGVESMVQQSAMSDAQTRAYAAQNGLKPVADGMRTTATDFGLTQNALPPAQFAYRDDSVKGKA